MVTFSSPGVSRSECVCKNGFYAVQLADNATRAFYDDVARDSGREPLG